jgi:hypothetical protein
MATISLDNTITTKTTTSGDKPVLNISKIVFVTDDKNWVQRLFNSMLTIKFSCIGSDKKEKKSFQRQISISSYITPYHKQAILEPNLWLSFEEHFNNTKDSECDYWKTTIELNNLSFINPNESLQISLIDKDHILKRIEDWKKRVNNLYEDSKNWINERQELSIINGNPTPMYEELMQRFQIKPTKVDTADILKGNKIVLSLKPKGLWMIGANGRVDIISTVGNYILIDVANQFETPNWQLFKANDRQNGKPFNQTELFNLINQMQ